MSRRNVEDTMRDDLYRQKLRTIKERALSNRVYDGFHAQSSERMVMSMGQQEDLDREFKIRQIDADLQEARRKYEKLKMKVKYQDMERGISSSLTKTSEPVAPQPPDRLSQLMEMMLLQQTHAQNMVMNQMMLSNSKVVTPPQAPPCIHNYQPQTQPYPYPSLQQNNTQPMVADPPAKVPTITKLPTTTKVSQPYPGNDAQRTLRQMGFAALFCAILDCDFEEQSVSLTDMFIFEIKIKEIMASIERYYLNPTGEVSKMLTALLSEGSSNFKNLITKTGTSDELSLCEKELTSVFQGLVTKVTEMMPSYGTLGCECRSILSEYLHNNQRFPGNFFWPRELDLLKMDSNGTIRSIGFVEAQFLLIGLFFAKTLVMHVLMKPVEYNLCSSISVTGQDNLRIVASLLMHVYQAILSEFLSQRYPNEAKGKKAGPPDFGDLGASLMTEAELQPLLKSLKKPMEACKAEILKWGQAYVMKLRPV